MESDGRKNGKGAGNGLLFAGMALAAAFWCFEAVIHTFVLKEADLATNLIHPETNELWMRLVIAGLIIGLGAYARQRIIERVRAEGSLRESEEKLRSMTAAAMDAIVMIDPDARIIHWNPAAERVFGYSANEAIGASLPSLIVPARYHARLIKAFDAFRHTGKGPVLGKTVEMIAMRKDGAEFPVEHTISPLRLKGRWHAVGIIKDITERKRATEELRALSARNSAVLEAVPDIIMEVDCNKVYTWANRAGLEFFGADVIGKEASHYFESEQETYAEVKPIFNGSDDIIYVESWQRRLDGEKRLLAWWCRALKDADGNVTGALSSARDVTETRQAEEEITRIFNLSPDLMCIASPDGLFKRVNPAWETTLGYTTEEVLSTPYLELIHPDDRESALSEIRKLAGGASMAYVEIRLRRKDGSYRLFAWKGFSAAGGLLYAAARDITERKEAEEELRKKEERFRDLIESTTDWIWEVDENVIYTYSSPRIRELLGYESEDIVGKKTPFDLMSPEEAERVFCEFSAIAKEHKPFAGLVNINIHKDGHQVVIETSGVPIFDLEGKVKGYRGIDRDITERRRAEHAVRRSEERYREVLENVDEIIFSVRFDGGDPVNSQTEFVSPAVERIFGRAPQEFMNDQSLWLSSIHPDDLPSVSEATNTAIKTGQAATRSYRIRNKETGELKWLEEKIVPQKGPDGTVTGLKGVARDVTERVTAEERIRQEAETTKNLLKISEAVAATTNMDKLVSNIVKNVQAILGPDLALSYLWDSETRLLRPADAAGLGHDKLPLFRTEKIKKDTPFVDEALGAGSPAIIDLSEVHSRRALKDSGLYTWVKDPRTLAFIPLRGRRVYLGLLVCVYLKGNPRAEAGLGERELELMQGISHQVSKALEEARLYKDSIDRAMELSHKIETIKTMNEIDRSILSTLDPQEILDTAVSMTGRLVACDTAQVLLLDSAEDGFRLMAGYGVDAGNNIDSKPLEDASASEAVRTVRPIYLPNMRSADINNLSSFCKSGDGCLSRLIIPLIVKGKGIGVLSVCSNRPSAFTPEDLSTLEKLSAQISVALENSRLIKDLEELLIGTIRALSETIDAKSPWTRGHSDRVTSIALDISREMNLTEAELKDLEIAGLLHDIGKIGTYEGILDKPGRLTEEESREMKKHPGRGADMLSHIKQLQNIIPAIRHHHEFYNGEGYPDGIKGVEIPILARILTVADTVDAMSADRPYRNGLGMNVIIEELKRCSGTQFDAGVVEAFLKTEKIQKGHAVGE